MTGWHPLHHLRRRVILWGLVLMLAGGVLFSITPAAHNIVANLRPPTPMVWSAGVVGISVGPLPSGPLEWDTFIPPIVGLPYLCGQRAFHTIQDKPPVWIIFWHCSP